MPVIKKGHDHVVKMINTISRMKDILYLNVKNFTEKSHVSQIIKKKKKSIEATQQNIIGTRGANSAIRGSKLSVPPTP